MTEPKKWKAGIADETWKVIICGRDLHRIKDLESALVYYLTGAGSNTEKGFAEIREMNGAQILDALADVKRSCLMTVQAGLGSKSDG